MRIQISKHGRSLFINIDSNKPKWLVNLLFPFYWRLLPWKDTQPLDPLTFDPNKKPIVEEDGNA